MKEGLGEKGKRRGGEGSKGVKPKKRGGYERLRKRNNIMCISYAYHVHIM